MSLIYNKTDWKDDKSTPINAYNLNNIEDGIEYIYYKWDKIIQDATTGDHAAELIDARYSPFHSEQHPTVGHRLNHMDEVMYALINGRNIDGGNLGDEGIRNIYDGGELDGNIDDVIIKVDGVYLNTTSHTFDDFTTLQLTANILPTDATNKNVIWRSYNSDIATVNDEGLVTAISNGSTNITVTTEDGNYTATCNVTVNKQSNEDSEPSDPPISPTPPTTGSIVLNETSFTINQGEALNISANINVSYDYAIYDVRRNGEYVCSAYRNENNIICSTYSLIEGDYYDLTIIAKVMHEGSYTDIAQSQPFNLTVIDDDAEEGESEDIGTLVVDVPPSIKQGQKLEISYTTSASLSEYTVWELRRNGEYLCSAYKDSSSDNRIIAYTELLLANTYDNITLVAKEYKTNKYTDIAISSAFVLTVEANSTGGGGSDGDNGGSTPPVSEDEFAKKVLSLMPYPRVIGSTKPHECIPNGAPYQWNRNARWENPDKPEGWKAFGGWAQVYRVEGTPFSQNTGVELKDYCVYGWKNGQWHLVTKMNAPTGYFYAEAFEDDKFGVFPGKMLYFETSVAIRLTEDMKVETSQGPKNVCYHPFTTHLDYDPDFEYVFTCVSMRKIKWDEHGVDDRDSAKYCASCGGDWWREKGLSWAPDWSNNKGIAQPVITEVTNDWKVFTMTTVPEDWEHGFPR